MVQCIRLDVDVSHATREALDWATRIRASAPAVRQLRWCSVTTDVRGLSAALRHLPDAMDELAVDLTRRALENRAVSTALRALSVRSTLQSFLLHVRIGDTDPEWPYTTGTDGVRAWISAIGNRTPRLRVTVDGHIPVLLLTLLFLISYRRSKIDHWFTSLSFCLHATASADADVRRYQSSKFFLYFCKKKF